MIISETFRANRYSTLTVRTGNNCDICGQERLYYLWTVTTSNRYGIKGKVSRVSRVLGT
jgi:hypothetical protein